MSLRVYVILLHIKFSMAGVSVFCPQPILKNTWPIFSYFFVVPVNFHSNHTIIKFFFHISTYFYST